MFRYGLPKANDFKMQNERAFGTSGWAGMICMLWRQLQGKHLAHHHIETHCIILQLLHRAEEMPWLSQLTKN